MFAEVTTYQPATTKTGRKSRPFVRVLAALAILAFAATPAQARNSSYGKHRNGSCSHYIR